MIELRDYQHDIIGRARQAIRAGKRAVLIVSPTGSGKTALTAHMMYNATSRGHRAFFNVHRRELVKQSVLTLSSSANIGLGIVAAGFPGNRNELAQVCSVQTLARRHEMLLPPDVVIWDECHHMAAASWGALLALYPNAIHIGLTATPERLDGTGLGSWFSEMILGPSVRELIEAGYLCDYRLFAPSTVDLAGVHTVAGDYNKKELAAAMGKSKVVGDAIGHYRKHCDGARAIVFMWSVESSIEIARKFNEAGIPAAHIDGKTDDVERDATIEAFRAGRIKVLSNVEIVSEGFDLPAIEAAFLLRPTKSLGLYLQQVGRALRPFPGKSEALIFDHCGLSAIHGLPDDDREWTLDGRRKRASKSDGPPVKQCSLCFATVAAAASVCRHCGYKFQVDSRVIEQVEGELTPVDREAARRQQVVEQAQAKTIDDLIRIGTLRGMKNPAGWAKHVYNARLAKEAAIRAERWAHSGEIA